MALKLLHFLIALGITLPNFILADYRDDYDKRDYTQSTSSVNRSSDIRANRTMDTRPPFNDEPEPGIDSSSSLTTGIQSVHSDRTHPDSK
jgi:hypothetical protein